MRTLLTMVVLMSLIQTGCASSGQKSNAQGIKLAESEEYQKAIPYFDKAIQIDRDNSGYYNNRGNAYYALKQYERAVSDYTEAIRLTPGNPLPYGGLGNVYDDIGQPERASEYYSRAIELKPDEARPYRNRGVTLMRMREFARALPDFDRAIDLSPSYVLAYLSRTATHAALNAYAEATRDYTRAMALDPKLAARTVTVLSRPINPVPDVTVDQSTFGTWQGDDQTGQTFVQTGRVPLVKNQFYGWFLHVTTSRPTVRFRETLRLPRAPVSWGSVEGDRISPDRQMVTIDGEARPTKEGLIGHSRRVAEGDPEGVYIINIFVEDKPVETFVFWVGK